MITAAIHATPVAPIDHHDASSELARISCEIAERLAEMHEIKFGSGLQLIERLATIGRLDNEAYGMVIDILHGHTECLLDSYAVQAERAGREKQTIHYRRLQSIEVIRLTFPDVAAQLDRMRLSVKHHEDPISKADVLREATE